MGRSSPGLYQSHDILIVKRWRKRAPPVQRALTRERIADLARDIADRSTCVRLVLALDGRALTIPELATLVPRGGAAFRGVHTGRLLALLDDLCIGLALDGRITMKGVNGHRVVRGRASNVVRLRPRTMHWRPAPAPAPARAQKKESINA